ncbi:hypothetical protein GCM10023192_15610 [Amycolatopsis samaneae]
MESDGWPVAYYNQDLNEWRERHTSMAEIILELFSNADKNNILRWNLDDEPAVFRVLSTCTGKRSLAASP